MSSASEKWQNVFVPSCTIIGDAIRYTFLEWTCGLSDPKKIISLHKKPVIVMHQCNTTLSWKEMDKAIIMHSNRIIPDCTIYFPPERQDMQIINRDDTILQRMRNNGKTKWLYFLDIPYERESEILEIQDLLKEQNQGILTIFMKPNMATASTDLDTSEEVLKSAHELFDSYNIPWIDAGGPKDVVSILHSFERESATLFRKLKVEEEILNDRIYCVKDDVRYMLEDEKLDEDKGLLSVSARMHIFNFRKIQKYHCSNFAEALIMSANEWLCKGQRNITTIAGDLLRSIVEACPLFNSLCGEEWILNWEKELTDHLQIEIMSLLQHATSNIHQQMPKKEPEYLIISANGTEQNIWNTISNSIDSIVEHSVYEELKNVKQKLIELREIMEVSLNKER